MKKVACNVVDYAVPKTRVEHTQHLVSNLYGYGEQKTDVKNACDHPMYL